MPLPIPASFDVARVPFEAWQGPKEWSPTEFKARASFAESLRPDPNATQSLRQTTVWQRLRDYGVKDGVRLITLWEMPGSTLSIQTSKHGEPSLQWSSRSMNRGGATRGLLDSMIAASLGAAGLSQLRSSSHDSGPASAPLSVRPVISRTARASVAP